MGARGPAVTPAGRMGQPAKGVCSDAGLPEPGSSKQGSACGDASPKLGPRPEVDPSLVCAGSGSRSGDTPGLGLTGAGMGERSIARHASVAPVSDGSATISCKSASITARGIAGNLC